MGNVFMIIDIGFVVFLCFVMYFLRRFILRGNIYGIKRMVITVRCRVSGF